MPTIVPTQYNPDHPLIPGNSLATSGANELDLWIYYLLNGRDAQKCLLTDKQDRAALLRRIMTVDTLPEANVYACHFTTQFLPRFTLELDTEGVETNPALMAIDRILGRDLPDEMLEKFDLLWSRSFVQPPRAVDRIEELVHHIAGSIELSFNMGTDGCSMDDFVYEGGNPFQGFRMVAIAAIDHRQGDS